MKEKINIAISGVGNRALPKKPEFSNWLGWVDLIKRSEDFQLVAAHDVAADAIKRIVERGYLSSSQCFQGLDLMLEKVTLDAILISNPAEYHAETIRKALDYNLHLLIEKPFVNNLDEGKELIYLIKEKGNVAAVIQNWRSKDVGRLIYEAIQADMIGKIGQIFFRYIRNRENPDYPPYIFEEKLPLLYAMGIHHLDLFRYILKQEYQSVSGHSFKPHWSMYKSDTGLNLFLKTNKDVSIIYSGTISSRNNLIPQESLVIEGEKGSLLNDSQWLEPPLWFFPLGKKEKVDLTQNIKNRSIVDQYNIADIFILKNFYQAITDKKEPICSAKDGLQSVAVLEASRIACETSKAIFLDQL